MKVLLSRILKREPGRPTRADPPVTWPGGPPISLVVGNYYLVAILEPLWQIAVMQHEQSYGATGRAYWVPYLPRDIEPGPGFIIPLLDLGKEVTFG